MRKYYKTMITGALLLSSSVAVAQAPQAASPPPNVRTLQFGDWVLTCRKADASAQAPQNCELVQTIMIKGQKDPFAQLAIGKVKPEQPLQVTVVVPHNITLPSSVKIAVDEKDKAPIDVAWTRCVQIGCFASAPIKDDTQKKWSSLETQGRVTFKAGNGQDVAIPISFKGLKAALEALAKEK